MKLTSILLLLSVLALSASAHEVSMFYCGFGENFCGQSAIDDVHQDSSFVILAFVNTNYDGSVTIDDANFPTGNVNSWQSSGKKVIISVGGQNGNWQNVFASQPNIDNFVDSLYEITSQYNLDGVDLDIENYATPPITVSKAIIQLKEALGSKLLIVSPEDIGVYAGTTVPDQNTGGIYWNYWVPIINRADSSIDYYQPQAYNNWFDSEAGGSLEYLKDVYENWRNIPGEGSYPILPDFIGVSGDKLLIGIMASPQAGVSSYYSSPGTIRQFKKWINDNGHPLKGFMLWDSHWDSLNGYAVSNECLA